MHREEMNESKRGALFNLIKCVAKLISKTFEVISLPSNGVLDR